MKKILLLITGLIYMTFNLIAQTITIYPQSSTQPKPGIFKPGVFLVPKTPTGTNDFLNNGIQYNSIRTIDIETALNYWTVSSIVDVMAQLESQKSNILIADSRCDKLIIPILKMPLWLSSSTDTTSILGGFKVFNAMPPANYDTWNVLMDSIVSKINNQWGLDPYYEIWNEPENGYWQGTTDEYFEFFKKTYFAIKTNHPIAKIGGPTVGNFATQFTSTFSNGYLTSSQLDSTIIGMVIDSCVSWNAPLDFISWHKFGANLYTVKMEMDYINQKLVSSGHSIVPYIISEWNLPSNLRESTLDPAFMVNYSQAMKEYNIDGQMVAAWQDFDMETTEFHKDYGLISWGALHKPSWKALQLLNKLDDALLDVDGSDYRNLNAISSYQNDTLKILISNYSLPGLEEATLSLYFNHNISATDLINGNYNATKLDSIFQGLIALPGTDPLTLAINSVIPIYQTAEDVFQNGRDIDVLVPNLTGVHIGIETNIDSTRNNVVYQYDSLITAGYTRTNAVNFLYPNSLFLSENISMTDSIYSFHIQPNGVALIELYIPETILSITNSNLILDPIVYPNPTTDFVHVNIDKKSLQKIDIYDINGRLFKTVTTSSFSVKMFTNGIYLLIIQTDKGILSKKLIKE